jgi:predicted DsbA family dithiol-disulfide isomerase
VRGRSDVTVEWQPFELRPHPTPTLRPEGDYLQRAWQQSVYPLARRMGVEIKLPAVSPQPHTHLAWEGFRYAREHGRGNDYNHRVLEAFFVRGEDVGSTDVLTQLAKEVGLDEDGFRQALVIRKYREAHQEALRQAHEAGVTAVPAFVVGRSLLTGLQSEETLRRAIDADLREQQAEAGSGGACGPDGCPAG